MKYLVLALIIFMSCHPTAKCDHDRIVVKNNSSNTLYFIYDLYSEPLEDSTLGDFFINPKSLGYITYNDSEYYRLRANSVNDKTLRNFRPSNCFSYLFHREQAISIQIFFIDSSVISTLSWDTVKKYNLHLKHVMLNGRDLDSLGWKVSYP